jgi:hypothetical protein
MAFAYSTISTALTPTSTTVTLTSGTGVTASNFQGAGTALTPGTGVITYLLVEHELMQIISLPSTTIAVVKRGMNGTRAMAHPALCPFIFGLNTDFLGFRPAIDAFTLVQPDVPNMGTSVAVAATATIQIPGPLFHLTGTTSVTNMQPPTSALLGNSGPNSEENYVNGYRVSIICDGAAVFTSGGGGSGPAIALTVTARTAASFIDFILDTSSGAALWYPSVKST